MWLPLSLGTAVCAGTSDALSKKALQANSVRTVAWVRVAYGTFFLLPLALFAPAPTDPRAFWSNVAMAMPLEVAACFCYQNALRVSPLSLAVPYLAFTPVFLLGMGWMFLGERISNLGVLGILLVTSGAFLIQAGPGNTGPISILRSSAREKGPLLVLAASFLYAFTSVFAKKALLASSPYYFSGMYYGVLALCLTPFLWKSGEPLSSVFGRPGLFLSIGAMEASAFILQFHAFLMTKIAFVIAVKRLSLPLAVIYGRVLFKETDFLPRLGGAALMFTGVLLLAFT